MSSYQYRNYHYIDKKVSRPFYLYNGESYTRKEHLYIEAGPRKIEFALLWCDTAYLRRKFVTLYNVITESACLSIWVVFHERGKSMNLQTHSSHHNDVTMSTIASQITSLTIAHSTVCPCVNQRNHQSSASLSFVRGIHRWSVNFPHKWTVTRKMFPFDDVIMYTKLVLTSYFWIFRPYFRLRPRRVSNDHRAIGLFSFVRAVCLDCFTLCYTLSTLDLFIANNEGLFSVSRQSSQCIAFLLLG